MFPIYTVEHTLGELAVFEEILLTYVSPVRLMTPGGLAVQRHMLPDIIAYALTCEELAPIVNLVLKATEELLEEELITFTIDPDWAEAMKSDGYVHLSTVTREYGSDGRYQVNFTKLAANGRRQEYRSVFLF